MAQAAETQDRERDRLLKEFNAYLREKVSDRFFGKILITLREGQIVVAEEQRTFKF